MIHDQSFNQAVLLLQRVVCMGLEPKSHMLHPLVSTWKKEALQWDFSKAS